MSPIERLRRPEPARRGPLRQLGALAARGEAREPAPVEAAPSEDAGAAPAGPAGAAGLGYRVIEDYLRQGREAAERLAGFSAGAGSSFQSLSERMLRDGLLWLEYVAKAWGALDPARAPAPPGGTAAAAPGPGAVRVRLDARVPAEVTLELRAGAAGRALGVHPLRSPDAGAPAIEAAEVAAEGEGASVALRVPDGQPAGLYTGVVYDRADGSVQGTLCLRVEAGPR